MSTKNVGLALSTGGLVLVLVSALADVLGAGDFYRLGTQQIAGMIAGTAVAVVGIWMLGHSRPSHQ